jgi:hypothetical protein
MNRITGRGAIAPRSSQEDTMNRHSKLLALTATAVATSLMLAACGGGDATPPSASSAINAGTTAPAPDTKAPSVTIFDDTSAATATGPVTFTFVFSEDVGASFTASDVVVTGGTAGAFTKVSATQATLVVTPTANTASTINVSVAVGTFSDLAGNSNTVGASASQAYNSVVLTQMALPVSFDSTSVAYGLVGFGGAEDSTIAADPTNAANKVAKVVRAAGSETYAGTTITASNAAGVQTGFSPKIPFTVTDTRMTVKVWSPDAGIPVRLKVEDSADPNKSVETEATVTTAAGWQTLTFDFAAQAANTSALNLAFNYNKATIFFDFGRAKTAAVLKTYYFDDLTFLPGAVAGGGSSGSNTVVVNFDEATAPKLTDFGVNGSPPVIAADPTGGSNKVLKIFKYLLPAPGSEQWAGVTVSTGANDSIPKIPFTATAKTMTLRVYSPAVGVRVRLKVEDATNNGITCETDAITTMAGAWETLTFNFATPGTSPPVGGGATSPLDLTKNYTKASIFMDFGIGNGGSAPLPADRVYYVDDLIFVGAAAAGGSGGSTGGASNLTGGVFASNYTEAPTPWMSLEGGTAGRYIDTSVVTQDWWSGLAAADATPSFYFGYGINSAAKPWGFGAYVSAPKNGTAQIASFTNVKLAVWGNDQLVTAKPTMTVILKGPTVSACTSELKGSFTVAAAGVQTYTLPLSGFTLQTACGYANAAAALAAGVTQIHVQVLGTNVQYTTGGDAAGNFPNGLNIGPIQFN